MNSEDLKEGESRWEGGEAVEQWGGGEHEGREASSR